MPTIRTHVPVALDDALDAQAAIRLAIERLTPSRLTAGSMSSLHGRLGQDNVSVANMKTTLFVSGDADHRELYVPALRHAGYGATVINGIVRAAERLRRLPADAVILHLERDDDSAWQDCRVLIEAAKQAPVVMITSWVRPDAANVRRSMAVGCAAFVAEPCVPTDLVLVLQRVLAGERSLEWPFSRLARRSRPAV